MDIGDPTLAVRSEVAPLERIVTSPPGPEFDLMLPENLERYRDGPEGWVKSPDYLLFDDLVLLSAMQAEHRQLVDVVSAVTGPAGHTTWRQLLSEALEDDDARASAITDALALERDRYGASAATSRGALEALDAPRLADAFVSGRSPLSEVPAFRWPAPNVLFARDLFAVAGDAIISTYAAEPARAREMLLSRVITRYHRQFCDVPKLDIGDGGRARPGLTLEGGDIQVLDERVVLVGVGIRTTLAAVEALAPLLFARGFEVVLAFEMPRRRAAMHIDTLFTRIDAGHCLIYPPLVEDPVAVGASVHRLTPTGRSVVGPHLLGALSDVGVHLTPVYCGGSDPVAQAREQWSDGANAFALAPGIIVCYGRNPRTLRELNRVGYEIMSPARFVDNALFYVIEGRRIVVALQGHELVRGRGGPRCLTLPLRRGALSD